jgi:hypothetical protein
VNLAQVRNPHECDACSWKFLIEGTLAPHACCAATAMAAAVAAEQIPNEDTIFS